MPQRVRFLTSHPIQYQAPVFRHLAENQNLDFEVWFCQTPDAQTRGDGFGVDVEWDIPILEGYRHRVLENVSKAPSVTHFRGCDTPQVHELIRFERPDAVIINGWVVKSCIQTLNACRKERVPAVVRCEANLLRPRARWKHWIHRRLVSRFSAFAYIGNANRDFYRSHGIQDDSLFFSPYCIDNERFKMGSCRPGIKKRARQRWQIDEHAACFVYSGKFIDKKHPLELVRAFADASRNTPSIHLLMVGDGERKEECESVADALGVKVTFTGFLNQSEISDAYAASDCLVLPSDHGETWGLVANEAMACGVPVITSDQAGCHSDLIHNDKTGRVFPFGDWTALAASIHDLGGNRDLLSTMGNNAQKLIAGYSPRIAAEGLANAVSYIS
jgi:glycosyltransferase involved in cell wall biosynthesis